MVQYSMLPTPWLWIVVLFCWLPIFSYGQDIIVQEIADGVFMHQGAHQDLDDGYQGDISNIGFVIGSKGVAVIDTGGSLQVGQALLATIRKHTVLPILYVINTHIHPDHIFGNAAFQGESATFIGHEKLASAMLLRQDAYLRQGKQLLGNKFAGSEVIPPTLPVTSSLELDLGNRQLLLTAYANAHTNTDLTVLDKKTRTLWTGDLLFIDRTPSIDGDIKGWLNAITQLQQLEDIRHAIPGHGPSTNDLQSALNHQARYLNVLLSDVREAIKVGKSMEYTMDHAAAAEAKQWKLFNAVNRRNINLIYPALEWE